MQYEFSMDANHIMNMNSCLICCVDMHAFCTCTGGLYLGWAEMQTIVFCDEQNYHESAATSEPNRHGSATMLDPSPPPHHPLIRLCDVL